MKILHVITSLEIGGAQRLISDLLPLQRKQVDVTLLVYKREENDFTKKVENASVPIISLEESNFYNPRVIFRLRKIFKEYDIIHVHLFPSLYWSSFVAKGTNTKLIYTEHSTSNSRRGKWYLRQIEKFIYSRYSKIISISQQTQKYLTEWLQSNDKRFVVINNGVNTKAFSSFKKPIIPKSLIMVSRFASSKDQETVIRAMKQIDKDAILRFVGDGENKANCECLAKELGLADRVQFLGSRSDVAELIAESHIGIQSSNWEGFGLTAVEIMASGKPVLASNVDGLRQIVEGAGVVFSKRNSNELAENVNQLLNEKAYYNKIAEQCFVRAKEYDINIMADSYLKVYKEIMLL